MNKKELIDKMCHDIYVGLVVSEFYQDNSMTYEEMKLIAEEKAKHAAEIFYNFD